MIDNLTFHIIDKQQQQVGTLELNPNQSMIPTQIHSDFLNELNLAYKSRSGKGFGIFDEDKDSFPMPKLLEDYINDKQFYALTERMMNVLLSKMNAQPLSTGGTVFVMHYHEQNQEYILIALLSGKISYATIDWQIQTSEILDIEHLKFAGRINLTAWQNNESRYISFLKGQGEIAGYFKEFLACNDALFAKAETKKLIDLLEEFCTEQKLDIEKKTQFLEQARDYLKHINQTEEPFELESFANKVWHQSPQILKDKLANPDNGIADGFIPDKRVLNSLSTHTGKTSNWRLTFDNTAIANGDILLENGKIVITNPTQELIDAFS